MQKKHVVIIGVVAIVVIAVAVAGFGRRRSETLPVGPRLGDLEYHETPAGGEWRSPDGRFAVHRGDFAPGAKDALAWRRGAFATGWTGSCRDQFGRPAYGAGVVFMADDGPWTWTVRGTTTTAEALRRLRRELRHRWPQAWGQYEDILDEVLVLDLVRRAGEPGE